MRLHCQNILPDFLQHNRRNWLESAMVQWRHKSPVKVRLTCAQAERLQQDWYYRHADFEPLTEDQVLMTFGEQDLTIVMELLRWLGPGAALLELEAWREKIREEVEADVGLLSSL